MPGAMHCMVWVVIALAAMAGGAPAASGLEDDAMLALELAEMPVSHEMVQIPPCVLSLVAVKRCSFGRAVYCAR